MCIDDLGRARPSRRMWLAAAALLAAGMAAAAPPVNTLAGGLLGARGNIAILGYDTVAYFTDGRAVKGLDAYTAEYRGAKWKFASQAHLDLFKADPAKYAPQYGGYCAYGVAQGALVKIDPEQFKVVGGKLYLNFDAEVQKTWLEDPQRYIREADGRFQSLLKP
jgi:YHS domain-containing protein